MFFEARLSPIATSPAYARVAEAFERGDTTAAHALAVEAAAAGGPQVPADFLLVMDVCRARGEFSRSNALCRIARRRFPDDPMVRLAWARTTSIRGRDLESIELLRPLADHPEFGALARGMMASSWGTIGARRRFRELADPLRASTDPRVRYMLGYGAASLREWDEAIEHLAFTVDHAPRWIRAIGPLCDFLLARGRVPEVERRLVDVEHTGLHDVAVDVAAFAYLSARRRWDDAVALAERAATRWPRKSLGMFAGGVALAYWMLARRDDAVRWATIADPELAERFAKATPARRKLLDAPLRCQERSMCLPVSVSLVCSTQGVDLDPVALYGAMEGHGGASFSKMKAAIEAHGFDVHTVKPEVALVRSLLDEGIALVGPLYGPGLAHVEVVCGYDEALDLLYVRDPESWILRAFSSDALDDRYREHGGLIALVRRPSSVVVTDEARAPGFAAFIAFEAAVTAGEIAKAQALLETIPDGPTRMLAHWVGHGVSSTTAEVRAYERRCLIDPALHVRFRAAVALQGDVADLAQTRAMLLEADADPRSWLIRMLDARLAVREGRWDDATRIVEELVQEAPSLASTWDLKATIAERLGDEETAEAALDVAYDIEPTNHGITSHWRRRWETRRPFADRLREVEEAWRRFESVETAWSDYVGLLASQGPDGAQVADLMARWTKRFPKSPDAWTERMRWYAYQDRSDLVESVRAEATLALGMDPTSSEAVAASNGGTPRGPNEHLALAMESVIAGGGMDEATAKAIDELRARDMRGDLDSLLHIWLAALDFAIGISTDPTSATRLPAQLTGRPLAAVRAFLDRISGVSLEPRHATELLAWIDAWVPDCRARGLLLWERAALERIRGHLRDTQSLFEALVEREPAHVMAMEELASLALDKQDLVGAIRRYEALIQAYPGQQGALSALSWVYLAIGDETRALDAQRRLVRRVPWSSMATERLLELTNLAALDEVAPYFSAASLRVMQASIAFSRGDHDRVLELLATEPLGEGARQGLHEVDDERLQRLRERLPLESRLALAGISAPPLDLEASAEAALAKYPDDPTFWRLRATVSRRRGDFAGLAEVVRRAITANLFDPALAALIVDDGESAVDGLLALVEHAGPPRRASVADTVASALLTSGQTNRFLEFARRCGPLVPDARELRLLYSGTAIDLHHHEDALNVLRTLLATNPEDAEARFLEGLALLPTKPNDAAASFREAIRISDDPRARRILAEVLEHQGKVLEARRELWDVLRRNPFDEVALVQLVDMREDPVSVEPYFRLILERGGGGGTPHFLLAAVDVANASRRRVSAAWLDIALGRLAALENESAESPDGYALTRAVSVWLRSIGEFDRAAFVERRYARTEKRFWNLHYLASWLLWPGRRWLPSTSEEQTTLELTDLAPPTKLRWRLRRIDRSRLFWIFVSILFAVIGALREVVLRPR